MYLLSDESKGNESVYASLPVHRRLGRFGTVTVDWFLTDRNASQDLEPTAGTLTFMPGEGVRYIELLTKEDEVSVTDY